MIDIEFREAYEIMIVDDTKSSLQLLTQILSDAGYKVRPATNGRMALRSIMMKKPDLILLDERMPDMDGIEVCRRLKSGEETRNIPIMFVSALDDKVSKINCFKAGGQDFITKPYAMEEILARVSIQLELKMHQDNLESLVNAHVKKIAQVKEATIASMAILAEFRDRDTGAHVQRTKEYIRVLVRALIQNGSLGMQIEDVDLFISSTPLHDIGKVGVPDSILYKPTPLTAEEFEIMKKHTIYGFEAISRTEQFLGPNSFLKYARELTLNHHEKYDGSGYPYGLKGKEIPLSARIMSLADVYDALVSTRPYKDIMTHYEAMNIITVGDERTKPTDFDPEILEAFIQNQDEFKSIRMNINDQLI